MRSLPLSVVLAAALAASNAQASEPEPPAAEVPEAGDASAHAIPALYTPAVVTRSGHEFIERCNDEAFARTRYPEGLADQCERLLGLWHGEARRQGISLREGPPIPNYGDALRGSQGFIAPLNTP